MKAGLLTRLKSHGLTDFQVKVLAATSKIPKGETRSYRQIAQQIGHPRAFRAVGTALRLNPFPVAIPCHRVIKSSGNPGNYSGAGGIRAKVALLKKEGAKLVA